MKKYYPIKIKEILQETDDCVSVELDIPAELQETFEYTQGQHVTLRAQINGEAVSRTYSLWTAPGAGRWSVAIKKLEGGKFSTFANDALEAGAEIEVMPPQGRFYTDLDPKQSKNYVAFAAGSGITPILSIIQATLETEPESTFTLFFGNRTAESIIFRDNLEDLKDQHMQRFRVFHFLSGEFQESELLNGRLSEDKVGQCFNLLLAGMHVDEAFICGPEPMIDAVRKGLKANGIEDDHIHFELFTSPEGPLLPKKKSGENGIEGGDVSKVTLILDGKTLSFDLDKNGDSLLNTALKKGADLPFACKGGVCMTCVAKIKKGKARMDVNYALEEEEIEKGYVLTCQCHPLTDELVVDYDVQ